MFIALSVYGCGWRALTSYTSTVLHYDDEVTPVQVTGKKESLPRYEVSRRGPLMNLWIL